MLTDEYEHIYLYDKGNVMTEGGKTDECKHDPASCNIALIVKTWLIDKAGNFLNI